MVISDDLSHSKKFFVDPKLIPFSVALDPSLIASLPPHITAMVGMDAVLKATFNSEEDWHVRFTNRLAHFSEKKKCVSKERSLGISMTLISASKGLLLVESTEEQFKFDMDIIFKSVLNL